EKDEKLKRYRRIGMKAVKEKEQLQKTVDSWRLRCSKEDSIGKPLYSRFTKTNDFKGVPHPLSRDYTPKPQEEIDESFKGSCGNTSEHSFETESESLSVQNEMSTSRPKVNAVRPKVNAVSPTVNTVRSRQPVPSQKTPNTLDLRAHDRYPRNQPGDLKNSMGSVTFGVARQHISDKAAPDTLSVLGKFDGKSDKGFLVDKPNIKGVGYRWMFDIDYLTDSMKYIPVSLENQANPHAGISEKTNNAGTSQTAKAIAFEEKDDEVELIVVPSAVKIPEEKDESRTSSTNSKKEETLTEPQKEKKDFSTDTSGHNPKIQAFRRELEEIALKHLGTVPKNNTTSTSSVNTGSEPVNTGSFDDDDSPMLELEIFHKSETGIFDEAFYDEEGVITDFNSLPTEIE
ncbi:hypothetical protein Tco_1205793, partial [Tanacetum coccineum]